MWKRTFASVYAANLITAVGMMSFLPFFPVHLRELGVEDPGELKRWTGLIVGAAPLAAALMAPLWGALGDRYGRRLMVVRAMAAIAVFVGLMAFARTPWELLFLRFGQGIFSGFIAPSLTLVSVGAPSDSQGKVQGTMQTALSAGSVIGPAVGSFGCVIWGVRSVYFGVAAAAVLALCLVLAFAREDPNQRRSGGRADSRWRRVFEGWLELPALLRDKTLRQALGLLFMTQFAIGAILPQLALVLAEVQGALPEDESIISQTGTLFSCAAAAIFVGGPLWGRFIDRKGAYQALLLSSLVTSVFLGLHGLAVGFASLMAAHVAMAFCMSGNGPAAFGVAAATTAEEQRGASFGAVFSSRALARSVAAMTGGALAAWLGFRPLFIGLGVLLLLSVGLRWWAHSRADGANPGALRGQPGS